MVKISILKPDDSREKYLTEINCETFSFKEITISPDRTKKDPVLAGIEQYWRKYL